ncbi:MAG TPA: alpha/beta family hydrolase [Candidatus Nitrosotalea sp.]|nr:alpha/beta family hydrolase [Candidatus Nitrosotalea sp.]
MRVLLAPSWRQPPESLAPWLEPLTQAGFTMAAGPRGRGAAERALEPYLALAGPGDVLGGQSFGARVASLAAASGRVAPAGLILISFPLSGRGERRCAHWPQVRCPVLLVSGSNDPLSPLAELELRSRGLSRAQMAVIEGAGHDLRARAPEVLDHLIHFLNSLHPGQGQIFPTDQAQIPNIGAA